jgi:hypothetical protein
MANSSFFKNTGTTSQLQTSAQNYANDAEKLAINPEDSQYTLSDGTTTGYSALHHAAKAEDHKTAAATSATASAASATSASNSAAASASSEAAAAASQTAAAASAASSAQDAIDTAADALATAADRVQTGLDVTSSSASATAAANSATAASTSQVAAAASAAAAANSYDAFDDRYLGAKTSDPTVDNDGDALVAGALYFSTTANEMRTFDGSTWIAASSAGGASLYNYNYTATASQTAFSGSDDNSNTLSYTVDNLIVTRNGVVLEDGTDYTATDGSTVTLSVAAIAGDEINIVAFKSFTTADMVSATNGGTFQSNVTVNGTLTATSFSGNGSALTGISTDLVGDTTPQLGGALDLNSNNITGTGNINITGSVTATSFTGDGSALTGLPSGDVVDDTTPQLGGSLDLNSNDITGTGNINNTGTITTDGLAVSAGSSISNKLQITNSGTGLPVTSGTVQTYGNIRTGGSGSNIVLDVGNAGASGAWLQVTNQTSLGATSPLLLNPNGGNVGIGTASPATPLEISATSPIIRSTHSTSGDYLQLFHNGSGAYIDFSADPLIIRGASNAERLRIDSSGNVGITGTATATSFETDAGGTFTTASGNDLNIVYPLNRSLFIKEDTTTHFTIDNVGNVGIGGSPNAILDVQAGSGADVAKIRSGSTNGTYFWQFGRNNSNGYFELGQATGGAVTNYITLDTAGRVTMPYQPSFAAKGSGTSYITTATIPFPVVIHNVGSHYNNSTYTFTAPIAGTYLFHAHVGQVQTSSGTYAYPWFRINGSVDQYTYAQISNYTAYISAHLTGIYQLSANDTVNIAFSGTGSYYNGDETTRFFGHLLG